MPHEHSESQGAVSPRENRKIELLKGIERRVDTIVSLKHTLDGISVETPPDQTEGQLSGFLETSKTQFPPGLPSLERLNLLEQQYSQMRVDDPTELSIGNEIDSLKAQPDVFFLYNLEKMVGQLIRKNKQVDTFRKDRDKLEDYVQDVFTARGQDFDWGAVNEVVFSPFSVSIVISPRHLERLKGSNGVRGFHVRDTPINVIRDQEGKAYQSTIDHENVHNVLDGVALKDTHNPYFTLKRAFERYEEGQKDNKRDFFGSSAIAHVRKLTLLTGDTSKSSWLVDQLHEEFLAHVQRLEERGFMKGNQRPLSDSFGFFSVNDFVEMDAFAGYSALFATAGKHAQDISRLLGQKARTTDDEEIRNFCITLRGGFQTEYVRAARFMEEGLRIAQRISPDAHISAHTLLYLLNPTQFHHIGTYLEYKYGSEQAQQATVSYQIMQELSFEPEKLQELETKVAENNGFLSEIDKQAFEEALRRFNVWNYEMIITEGTFGDYEALLTHIGNKLRIDVEQYMERVRKGLYENCYFHMIQKDLPNNFAQLPEKYAELPEDRKSIFREMLGEYLAEHIQDDLKKSQNKPLTIDQLKSLPIWSVIEQMSLAEAMEIVIASREESH